MSTVSDSTPAPIRPAGAASQPGRRGRGHRVLGWFSVAAIGIACGAMVALTALGPSSAVPVLPRTWPQPPLWFDVHPSDLVDGYLIYTMVLLGSCGVMAGLIAVRRGARVNFRLLAVAALAMVAVLTVLPPAGSTDSLSYAIFGRMAVLHRNPYTSDPRQLIASHDPVARYAPPHWQDVPSLYGPLATAGEWAAARLGGTSISRIIFWLKLQFSLAFLAVALAIDFMLRSDPARRARGHLLWTVNPLMLWELVAGAHCDALAAGLGFLGIATLWRRGQRQNRHPFSLTTAGRAVAAGLLIGAAADVKAPYILLAAGAAWALRRSVSGLAALAASTWFVVWEGYKLAGPAALADLRTNKNMVAFDSFWRLFYPPFGFKINSAPAGLITAAELAAVGLALLFVLSLPRGPAELPGLRLALALVLAWLLVWPMQRPWYDAIAFCLLAVFPASRLDWLLVARAIPPALVMATGAVGSLKIRPLWLMHLDLDMGPLTARVLLAAAAAAALLSLAGAWRLRGPPAATMVSKA